jgi:plastocyanin
MRSLVAALACLAGAFVLVHSLAGGREEPSAVAGLAHPRSPYSQQAVVVDVFEYGFQPGKVLVRAGQTVAWKDVGKQFHIVTPDSRGGKRVWAAAKDEGSASHLFGKPGRYPYHCSLHPRMHGVVVVRPKAPA